MKKYEMRLYALSNLISEIDLASVFGDEWYKFSDRFFSVLHVYKALELISDLEHEFIFESLNHCFYKDCFEVRPYIQNLYHDEIKKHVKKGTK